MFVKSPAVPGFFFLYSSFLRSGGTRNSCAPYFYRGNFPLYAMTRNWEARYGNRDTLQMIARAVFLKSNHSLAAMTQHASGLPSSDEQKKTRLRSHLSA
jgi:hypothetical protein